MNRFHSLQDVKNAVDAGKKVFVNNVSYAIIKDKWGQYLIYRAANEYCIGLTWRDGVTLNCHLDEIFTLG